MCGAKGATLRAGLAAADMHGHAEYCSFVDCDIDGSASLGGNHCKISGGTVLSSPDSGGANVLKGTIVRIREPKGADHIIENVQCASNQSVIGSSDFPFNLSLGDAALGGTCVLRNVTVIGKGLDGREGASGCIGTQACQASYRCLGKRWPE